DSLRSVVLSASYEARAHGVRSAMPIAHARHLCPQLVTVAPRHHLYREVSAQVMRVLATVTPVMEPLSIDEAFLDIRGARRLLGSPEQIAVDLRRRMAEELGLPCSVGGAGVKFVAKMASTAAKPNGSLIVPPQLTLDFLHPRPVEQLWGVGPRFAAQLRQRGIDTIGDLAAQDPAWLRERFGENGARVSALARGLDERPVAPRAAAHSIGADHTFDDDPTDPRDVERRLLQLCHQVARRLRAAGVDAQTVTVRVKAPDGTVRSRGLAPVAATHTAHQLFATASSALRSLLDERPHPVRLVGVRAERLLDGDRAVQSGLFSLDEERADNQWADAESALDAVARRFPGARVSPATLLDSPGRDPEERGPEPPGPGASP
ncbi:MAG: DNA polymerase IV, partial [Micrococcus sp.]|nr:DNA polymerase IV [Micrococcus sp.]